MPQNPRTPRPTRPPVEDVPNRRPHGRDEPRADLLQDSREALGVWLDEMPWSHWATFTFGEPWGESGPTPQGANRHIARFLEAQPGWPGYFYCIEAGRLGRVHGHALLRFDQLGIRELGFDAGEGTFARWRKRYGRAQVRTYDPELGAAYYCSKYLTKSPLHWDVGRLTSQV